MRLLPTFAALVLALSSAVAAPPARAAAPAATPDIPFERFRLDNGLTVVVHTDRKAPIVAVNVWYHVGGKDEPADRQEFAHWFEHLMFQGSENYRDEFFKPFEEVGATDQNGTTSSDRTNYFQNVPTTALDRALWMESDRMGHLLGALDQKVLDEQRGVVRNEKRQRENQPYGKIWDRLFEASFPQGHPYHAPDVSADKLLEGATLEEAKDWFRRYYGAANATLVLAGDIDVATAREKAQKYFGHIAPGRPLTRHQVDIAARTDARRDVMYDRVPQSMIIRSWNVPPVTHADSPILSLVSQVLGGSAASRLDARLVHRDQSADNVGTFNEAMEISGLFAVQVMVKAGQDTAAVEKAIEEEFARLLQQGPTKQELDRARTALRAGFVRGIERIGGFGGKSDVLAECQVFHGDPGCFRQAFAAKIPAQAMTADEALLLNRLLSSVRNAIASAKTLKDVRHDLAELESSDNEYLNERRRVFCRNAKTCHDTLGAVLALGDGPGDVEALPRLIDLMRFVLDEDSALMGRTMQGLAVGHFGGEHVSVLLSTTRAFTLSARQMLLAVKDARLGAQDAAVFENADMHPPRRPAIG